LKFIIDSGATHSLINPNLCHPKFISNLNENITLRTITNNALVKQKAKFPLFEELGNPNNTVEMYIFAFHDKYDGLIGNNILIPLKTKIDFENKVLITNNNKKLKLHFSNENGEEPIIPIPHNTNDITLNTETKRKNKKRSPTEKIKIRKN